MTNTENAPPTRSMALLLGFLRGVERFGNKLPHPFWLFTIMAALVVALSAVLNALGVSAVSPVDGETIRVKSLLTSEGVSTVVGDAVDNFAQFPPLALIIVVMLLNLLARAIAKAFAPKKSGR